MAQQLKASSTLTEYSDSVTSVNIAFHILLELQGEICHPLLASVGKTDT